MLCGRAVRSMSSIASQTPMSCCSAINASTCTRTSNVMSSTVPLGFVVSARSVDWPEKSPPSVNLRSAGGDQQRVISTVAGTYSDRCGGSWSRTGTLRPAPASYTATTATHSPVAGRHHRKRKRHARATLRHVPRPVYGVMRCLVHAVTRSPRVVIERERPPGRTTRPAGRTARPGRSTTRTTPHRPGTAQRQLRNGTHLRCVQLIGVQCEGPKPSA